MQHPRVLQLLMDSLRYWVTEMHVDGFRFDLASSLARELHEVNRLGAFFDILRQDPVLSRVKLIAEPWDLGEGGYQVGNFPPGWAEWNDKYRDTMRAYWKGDGGLIGEFSRRLTGSSDLYGRHGGCAPSISSPRTTASRWTSLSYGKHSRPNIRTTAKLTTTFPGIAVSRPDRRSVITSLRARQKRNMLATLHCRRAFRAGRRR